MFLYGTFDSDEVFAPKVAPSSCEPGATYCASPAGRYCGFGAKASVQCAAAGAPFASGMNQTPRSVAAQAVFPSAEKRTLPIVVDSSSSPPTRLAVENAPRVGLASR